MNHRDLVSSDGQSIRIFRNHAEAAHRCPRIARHYECYSHRSNSSICIAALDRSADFLAPSSGEESLKKSLDHHLVIFTPSQKPKKNYVKRKAKGQEHKGHDYFCVERCDEKSRKEHPATEQDGLPERAGDAVANGKRLEPPGKCEKESEVHERDEQLR